MTGNHPSLICVEIPHVGPELELLRIESLTSSFSQQNELQIQLHYRSMQSLTGIMLEIGCRGPAGELVLLNSTVESIFERAGIPLHTQQNIDFSVNPDQLFLLEPTLNYIWVRASKHPCAPCEFRCFPTFHEPTPELGPGNIQPLSNPCNCEHIIPFLNASASPSGLNIPYNFHTPFQISAIVYSPTGEQLEFYRPHLRSSVLDLHAPKPGKYHFVATFHNPSSYPDCIIHGQFVSNASESSKQSLFSMISLLSLLAVVVLSTIILFIRRYRSPRQDI